MRFPAGPLRWTIFMVIDWRQTGAGPPPNHPPIRAAEYVRMSTEHQEHSTDNQAAAIRLYPHFQSSRLLSS